ncbi:hypothetical protein AAL_01271 [Moelleriella libera RCEF 2490]|uniref:Uncharacterized protein n=1 Tax=Moelleriella libera RCEF 2490 TaxID=1081109 RepID=A0A166VLZ1_9HYPO|nr:hypothetical protein AAL_01271 [Moelleriella libera RCEF 2490]
MSVSVLPQEHLRLSSGSPRGHFKKHKILPRPRSEQPLDDQRARSTSRASDMTVDTSASVSQTSSPRTLKHQPKRIGSGPDLPPTPPNYSRASSGSHTAISPNPHLPDAGSRTPQGPTTRPPATPPDQRSPPTPDFTPPQPLNRPEALRPPTRDRSFSKALSVTTDSRTGSFKTAREEQLSSEDETSSLSARTILASSNPSQATMLRIPSDTIKHVQPQALGVALERLQPGSEKSYAPRHHCDFARFDGDWASPSPRQEQNARSSRAVQGSKLAPEPVTPGLPRANAKTVAPEDKHVTPTGNSRDVRRPSSQRSVSVKLAQVTPPKANHRPGNEIIRPSRSGSPGKARSTRHHDMSKLYPTSTVIGALLVDQPSPLQRQRTLRHVQKRRELREPNHKEDRATDSVAQVNLPPPSRTRSESVRRHDSHTSATSATSAASGRARLELLKNGAIPVVVIPDRGSSQKSKSREPSLRSSSSRQSKGTRSAGSSRVDHSSGPNVDLLPDRQAREARSNIASSTSLPKLLDAAQIVPDCSSSSVPSGSSRTSRTESLTVESIRALNEMHQRNKEPSPPNLDSASGPVVSDAAALADFKKSVHKSSVPPTPMSPNVSTQLPETPRSDGREFSCADHHDDGASTKKYSSRATPFSVMSLETNWTALEVSEAQAIHMYPHQNSSVLMVDHSIKPSDAPGAAEPMGTPMEMEKPPIITATSPEGGVTTPIRRQSLEEVDSPLRNPRAPPDPPSGPPEINFIPATPSGLTPAEEKTLQLGNLYETVTERPAPRQSMVKRAFSRRRNSISYPPRTNAQPGLLTRALSLTRTDRRSTDGNRPRILHPEMDAEYADPEDEPAEQTKLHPHWRPQWDMSEESYRYPPVDNRPRPLKRSLSARMKRTFAILPARDEHRLSDSFGPERRTIRRTPSGNLKVMRRRSSADSLRLLTHLQHSASGGSPGQELLRGREAQRWPGQTFGKLRRSSSVGGAFEMLPSLTRMWSERKRERRTRELRQKISGPREVRDGVYDMIRSSATKDQRRGEIPQT